MLSTASGGGDRLRAGRGLPYQDVYPAKGSLPSETVVYGYSTALDVPNDLGSTYIAPPGVDTGTHDQAHTVTAIHITHIDHDYTDVTIATPTGPRTITGTSHHLYWDTTTRAWTPADHLHIGDGLQTSNGRTTTITALRTYTATMVTYNLTIDHLHTYYVEAGDTAVLVHNDICGVRVSPVASDWATKGAHLHVGADEVRVFPTTDGGIGAEGIRLRTGMASDRSVQQVLGTLRSSPELRQDLIVKARSAMEDMNDHNWGNANNRAAEMNFLIKALEKMH